LAAAQHYPIASTGTPVCHSGAALIDSAGVVPVTSRSCSTQINVPDADNFQHSPKYMIFFRPLSRNRILSRFKAEFRVWHLG